MIANLSRRPLRTATIAREPVVKLLRVVSVLMVGWFGSVSAEGRDRIKCTDTKGLAERFEDYATWELRRPDDRLVKRFELTCPVEVFVLDRVEVSADLEIDLEPLMRLNPPVNDCKDNIITVRNAEWQVYLSNGQDIDFEVTAHPLFCITWDGDILGVRSVDFRYSVSAPEAPALEEILNGGAVRNRVNDYYTKLLRRLNLLKILDEYISRQ